MPTIVFNPNEIDLNAIRYPLGGDGQIHKFLASGFAPKQVIGDYTKDSDPERSTWVIIGGQTDGIGTEDFVSSKRYWFGSANFEYPGHSFLPRLATAVTSFPTLPTITYEGNDPAEFTGGSPYTRNDDATNWAAAFQSKLVSVSATYTLTKTAGPAGDVTCTLVLNDGVGTVDSDVQTVSSGNSTFTVTLVGTLNAAATRIRVTITGDGGADKSGTISAITYSIATKGTSNKMCNFNSNKYLAAGKVLYKLNSTTGAAYLLEAIFPNTITDVISSVGSCMYVFLGDADSYWYVDTAGTWTETNVSTAHLGIHWDNKLNKIPSTGQLSYSAAPNSATPSWTNKALLDTGSQGTINSLVNYADATGDDIIYVGTTNGLYAHDYTNALWLSTELQVPQHTDNGKGLAVRDGRLYYSAGMSVYEYSLSDGALTIRSMGLDKEDGLPDEYVGSIVKLVPGFGGDLYALVDASLISASNYSSIMRYDGTGWKPFWVDGTANEAMGGGLISTVFAYRFWFVAGGVVYYIGLDRAKRNPLKVSASTYATAATFYSPWFDAGWPQAKLALSSRALAKSTTADETLTISYRIDKAVLNLGTGWTTLDTLVLADAGIESVVAFGSSVGVAFKQIQFKVAYARGSTTTLTPDLIYLALEYERLIESKWGWTFTLDCTQEYNEKSASQLLTSLTTAAESQTLVPFYSYNTASYVRVKSISPAQSLTGDTILGQYQVTVVEK